MRMLPAVLGVLLVPMAYITMVRSRALLSYALWLGQHGQWQIRGRAFRHHGAL